MNDIKLEEKPVSNSESGILAAIWRKLIKDNGIVNALHLLVNRYITDTDPTKGRVKNIKRRNKSTLISNICSSEMTFKTFIDLIFNLLRASKLDIHVKVTFANGKSIHTNVAITNDMISKNDAEIQEFEKIQAEIERSKDESKDVKSGQDKGSD